MNHSRLRLNNGKNPAAFHFHKFILVGSGVIIMIQIRSEHSVAFVGREAGALNAKSIGKLFAGYQFPFFFLRQRTQR